MPARYYSPQGRVRILLSRCEVLRHTGETDRAQQDARQALELACQSKLPGAQAECLMMLADVHDQQGEMQAMRHEALAAMDLYRRLGDRSGESQAVGQIGIAVNYLEGPRAARPHYEQALTIAQTLGDRSRLLGCLLEMGWILIRTEEYENARRHLQEGLDMARSEKDLFLEAFGTSCLGEVALHQGRPEEALALHQRALAIRQQIGDKWFEAITWSWLSTDWEALGDYGKARKACERSLALYRSVGNVWETAGILWQMGRLSGSCGDVSRAVSCFCEELAIREQSGRPDYISNSWAHLSEAYFFQGDWPRAEAATQSALSGSPALPEKVQAALTLARLALIQGDRILAFGRLREAEDPVTASRNKALLFDLRSDWADFHLANREASSVRKALEALHGLLPEQKGKHAEPRLEVLAACLLACEGDAVEAETVFANALSSLQEMGLRWEEARSHLRFGRALGREKGRSYLQTAQALFSETGAAGWAALCDQALNS